MRMDNEAKAGGTYVLWTQLVNSSNAEQSHSRIHLLLQNYKDTPLVAISSTGWQSHAEMGICSKPDEEADKG